MTGAHPVDAPAPDRLGTPPPPSTAGDTGAPPRVRTSTVVAAGLGLGAVLVLALAVGGGRPAPGTPGLPQAGPLVEWGLPVAGLAGRIASLGTVGALLFAAVLLPGAGRALPAASLRAVRAASAWAAAWAVATVLTAVLTLSRLVGVPPPALPASAARVFVTEVAAGRAAVVVMAVALLVALLARRCAGPVAAGLLLAAAVSGLVVPAVLTGHSATADDHLLAVTTLAVHVVTAAVWVGGLVALVVHGRGGEDLAPAAMRFSAVALVCFLATGVSGLLAAWLVLGGDVGALTAAAGTGYGWLLAGKSAGLVALGVLGRLHRHRTLPLLRAGRPGAFRRFVAVEVGVMLSTVALAVALSASPPPAAGALAQPATPAPEPGVEDMSGHDHGELSVTVLVDETRFHVSSPVSRGARVTVHNSTTTEVTITADDGSFDVVVPGRTLITFPAPGEPGSYPFSSRHSPSFGDVLVVR